MFTQERKEMIDGMMNDLINPDGWKPKGNLKNVFLKYLGYSLASGSFQYLTESYSFFIAILPVLIIKQKSRKFKALR